MRRWMTLIQRLRNDSLIERGQKDVFGKTFMIPFHISRAPGPPEVGVKTYWPMKENPDYDAIDAKMKALIGRMEASFEKMLNSHVGPFLITI